MELPQNRKIFEDELVDLWFDEEGILYANSKNARRTVGKQKKTYQLIRQITHNKKVCFIADATNAGIQNKETREHAISQIPTLFKAMAVISHSALGNLIVNTFMTLGGQPIPTRLFTNEEDDWHGSNGICKLYKIINHGPESELGQAKFCYL